MSESTTCKSDMIANLLTATISPAWLSALLVILLRIALQFNLSFWKPSTAVRDFITTVSEGMAMFDSHKGVLGGMEFERKLLEYNCIGSAPRKRMLISCYRFKRSSDTLCYKLRVADRAFSWWNYRTWLNYISTIKKIFEDARKGQREAEACDIPRISYFPMRGRCYAWKSRSCGIQPTSVQRRLIFFIPPARTQFHWHDCCFIVCLL
ncbi:uncharacterized protein EV420DRAFT_1579462 [Desarmillaria tabescens]|uniref:Uncharacterized protein n=1 Tax=Armillaria tabescens TaxID=1929756 RepID=A0AA39JGP8_ARMTA|nr:uncharacterized protein EV420DRAFT_1579462 [Desarmillaria tabescens]KAK0441777.1 hypothetical protein EV420DRAFT_1579462 [Desarmillaria tabescens]